MSDVCLTFILSDLGEVALSEHKIQNSLTVKLKQNTTYFTSTQTSRYQPKNL
jgi:hypothetical protein